MASLGSSRLNYWRVTESEVDLVRRAPEPRPLRLVATPQAVTLDLGRTSILVIDMQNDFCDPDGWLGHIGVDVGPACAPIPVLAKTLPALRRRDVPVLWVNWGNRPDRLNLGPSLQHVYKSTGVGLGDPLPASGAHVLEKGSWSAAIVDGLSQHGDDIHVAKYRMSGFWDTPLDSILRNLGATTLLFAGVNLDQCLPCTLQDANFLGYDCILLQDCCATSSPDYCAAATLYNMRQCFGFVTTAATLLCELST